MSGPLDLRRGYGGISRIGALVEGTSSRAPREMREYAPDLSTLMMVAPRGKDETMSKRQLGDPVHFSVFWASNFCDSTAEDSVLNVGSGHQTPTFAPCYLRVPFVRFRKFDGSFRF